jgi:hypothetical protein
MPFLKGNVSFIRLATDLAKPRAFGDAHLECLRTHRAGTQRVAAADGVEVGWAAGDSVLDTDFTELKNVYPDHLLFDFCAITNKLPSDLLNAYYQAEVAAYAKGNPSGFASSRQKREAKQAARERLEQEAKDGRFIKRKCIPVLWDSVTNAVLFGSTSAVMLARFQDLFVRTFEGGAWPVTAGKLAERMFPSARDLVLARFVPGVTPDEVCWQPDAGGPPDFLGDEFLLWLWYHADAIGDTVNLPDDTTATIFFSGGLKVDDPRGQTGNGTMNSTSAVRLPEARTAIKHGKLPRKAALTFVRQGEQFSLILQAETLAVTSGKLPPPPEDVNGRARDEHRLQATRDLVEAVDRLFEEFLTRRLAPSWSGELEDMQHWLAGRGSRIEREE